ncbi:TIGR03435 family protein [Acidicapsa dinghuensis]|uniref:TIGR03435 family protein n=1 Tax=Acidicapsa dinghuensis TaxID=2218256 RepID=A0ABW1ECR7_9BACT|nr:TIGR03435 family protein [Acidicapsa dinghuensis]
MHKSWMVAVLIAVLSLLPVVNGQVATGPTDIVGDWQGTLHAGNDLRTVVKITKDDKGTYKATFYSIDQGGAPIPVTSVDRDGANVTITLNVIGGKFEGKLSADSNTIDGKWSQGSNPLPLVLTRTTPATEWAIPAPPPEIPPMAADANPSFDVATIKPNNSGANQMQGLVIRGRQFLTRASSVEDLISFAYQVQAKQIVGAPGWINTERYDIEAVPDAAGTPNPAQIRTMIQKLLADRFQLKFHHDQKELPAYVMAVGKGGEKLKPTELKGPLPGLGLRPASGGIGLHVVNATIGDFTGFLQTLVLDRPVVDKTALTGRYDFDITFAPDDSQFNGHPPRFPTPQGSSTTPEPSAQPNLFDALQAQVGLKLSAEKTSVDVLTIDHVDHPSAN